MRPLNRYCAILLLLWTSGSAFAQEVDDEAAVWRAVEEIWAAVESGDTEWVDQMLSADFMGWPHASPAPRSRASIRMWARFNAAQNKGLAHELYPLSFVVHGNVAVVHYLYTLAVQTKDKKVVVTNGRYTDVLVRDDTQWKFISWHGGDDAE